jgi:hypothetical protein
MRRLYKHFWYRQSRQKKEITPMINTTRARPLIAVTVIGQEGDEQTITVNSHQKCEQLLREALHALYGKPGPNPDDYDIVFNGSVIELLLVRRLHRLVPP